MRKNSSKKLFKHQVLVTGILVMAIVISTLGGSYAWFNSQIMKDEYNAFQEENFELSYVDNGQGYGDILSLVNQKPISDLEGSNQQPYRFSITNIGNTEKYFHLKIDLDQSIIEEDSCIQKLLSTNYIKYKLDNQEPKILGTLAEKDYEIYISRESIMPGSSEIHELRIWIDEDSPQFVESKHFHAEVTVEEIDPNSSYPVYTKGQAVTLLDGSKYHVMEISNSTMSKVKLLSDYNIDVSGNQDTNCTINSFIEEKFSNTDQSYYCSTINYQEAVKLLYGGFLTNLQKSLESYGTRINNVEVKMPELGELEKLLEIKENEIYSKSQALENWAVNLNFWTMTNHNTDTNYYWAFSSDQGTYSLKRYEVSSSYFGLRPVVVIDKENIQK